jgi:hypothetical protein
MPEMEEVGPRVPMVSMPDRSRDGTPIAEVPGPGDPPRHPGN